MLRRNLLKFIGLSPILKWLHLPTPEIKPISYTTANGSKFYAWQEKGFAALDNRVIIDGDFNEKT